MINEYILEQAESMGLSTIATGGGCDFVIKTIGDVDLVLSNEHLESPQSFIERGVVSFYRHGADSIWEDEPFQTVKFYTVRQAMNFMHTVKELA